MTNELMIEYNIQIDDIRWYLSMQYAKRLLEYKTDLPELAALIWSKKLEADLYEMEEDAIKRWENDLKQNRIDEARIREIFSEIVMEKRKRSYRNK